MTFPLGPCVAIATGRRVAVRFGSLYRQVNTSGDHEGEACGMADAFVLTPGALTLRDLRALLETPRPLSLDPASHGAIDRSAALVQAVIDRGETAYGINTGFGALARTHIKDEQLTELQRRLVLSHAAGTGEPLSDTIVRAILILK